MQAKARSVCWGVVLSFCWHTLTASSKEVLSCFYLFFKVLLMFWSFGG